MKGHTSKERLKRKAILATREYQMSKWLKPTKENLKWLKQEVAISKWPGHSRRHIMTGKNGMIALARRES